MTLSQEIRQQIENEAIDGTKDRAENDFSVGWNQGYEKGYEGAGEKYAEKWQAAEWRVKELEQWKKEAAALLNPLLEYGQAHFPLGRSITQELLRRAKLYKEAEQRATAHENTLKLLMGYFVKCHNNSETPDLLTVIHSIDEAITPKASTDEG